MPEINRQDASTAYTVGRDIMKKMFENGSFVLVNDADYARDAFEGCVLNCGMLVYTHAFGCGMAERARAAQHREIKSTESIAALIAQKTMVASAIKTILMHNNAWILSCLQAQHTKVNFENITVFLNKVYDEAVEKFKEADAKR